MTDVKDKLEELSTFYCDLYGEKTPNCNLTHEIDTFHHTLDSTTTITKFNHLNPVNRPLRNLNKFTNFTKVAAIIKNILNKFSTGPDLIPNIVIKN